MDGRQPPNDDHATPSNSGNPNVFDDEYALDHDQDSEVGFGVADGFRPGQQENGGTIAGRSSTALDHRASIHSSIRHSISENFPLDSKSNSPVPQQRSSIVKGGHGPRSSFTMANDDPNSPTPERSNTYSPSPRQTQLFHRASIASTSSFATEHASQGGFAGNSGPSHPYNMYPQGTGLARSSSVATASTVQTPQPGFANQGPAHPYAMYPQNVFEDPDEIRPAPQQNQIPVGFPGLGQGYHRQIGPDGEEQDIIGPDGHTEQLPPYSRFPEEGPTKASLMAVPEEFDLAPGTTATTGATETRAAAGAQTNTPAETPLGPPPGDPSGAAISQDTLSSSNSSMLMQPLAHGQQTPQSQEQPLQPAANSRSDDADTPPSENQGDKTWSEKTWKEKRKTRILWGKVPFWVLITAIVIIVILAVVLGVVIGTFMANEHMKGRGKDKGPALVTVISTESLFDAKSIPVPTGLPNIPLGKYALPIRSSDVSSNECLTKSEQKDAWSCSVDGPPLEINLGLQDRQTNTYSLWLQPLENTTAVNYGSQAPKIDPQELALVTDLDNPTDGPAWHFQTTYDKIVVLSSNDFKAGQNLKRDAHSDPDGYDSRYPPEGFTMPAGFRPRHEVAAGDTPWYCIWNQTFIEVFVYVEQNTSAAISAAATSSFALATATAAPGLSGYSTPAPSTYQSSPVTEAPTWTTSTSSPVERRGDDSDNIQWYPRVVKIEERRMASSQTPYCQKMQLLDDGRMVPVLTNEKKFIRVNLTESDPDYSDDDDSSSKRVKRTMWRRDDPSDACHCQWSFT